MNVEDARASPIINGNDNDLASAREELGRAVSDLMDAASSLHDAARSSSAEKPLIARRSSREARQPVRHR
jgi:hypothetical protein